MSPKPLDEPAVVHSAAASRSAVPFGDAVRVWLKIGVIGFGGPAGQIALMHRILVEEKRWIGETRFLHALNYCMLLPGPEAQQLATYVGWLLHGTRGGLVAGTLFVLPGALIMLALSILYAGYRDLALVGAVFFGVKAAVLAIVVEAILRIGRRGLNTMALYGVAAAAFVAIFFLGVPFPFIILAAAASGFVARHFGAGMAASSAVSEGDGDWETVETEARARRSLGQAVKISAVSLLLWFGPIAALAAALGSTHVFVEVGLFFSKMAVVTFGGAYAVLAYVAQQAVETYGWLRPEEMLDGLGLAETTPGPLIMVVQFVGFLAGYRYATGLDPMLAGTIAALITVWVTFVPCFLWIFLGAPYIESLRRNAALNAALTAITAAVVGVILNLALWFGLHVLFGTVTEMRRWGMRLLWPDVATLDLAALALTVAALVAMLRFKIGMLPTLAGATVLGVVYVIVLS